MAILLFLGMVLKYTLYFYLATEATAIVLTVTRISTDPRVRWYALVSVWLVANIVARLGSCILALPCFCEDRYGQISNNNGYGVEPRLKTWLSWFDTEDNSLLGDDAWKAMEPGHYAWRRYLNNWPALQAYCGRLGWLNRNPAYGFERSVLAAKIAPTDIVNKIGDPDIRDKPNGKLGTCTVYIGRYWNYNAVKKMWFSKERCVKYEFGWKLKTYAERPDRVKTEPTAQFAMGIGFKEFLP